MVMMIMMKQSAREGGEVFLLYFVVVHVRHHDCLVDGKKSVTERKEV